MKKCIFIASAMLTVSGLSAQEPADALRYSWTVPGGTARMQAIGGAMGSLGGDITATFVNPAGLAFFKTGDLVLTPSYQFGRTTATYLNRTERDDTRRFNWGTTGFVIGGGSSSRTVRNAAFSIAYNRMADFNSNILYRGQNTESSYSQKYLEEINRNNIKDGNVLSEAFPFGSSLAFNTFWIDTVGGSTNGNFNFQSRSLNILSASGLLQQHTVSTRGGIDEIALGLAANLRDKLMIGGTLGIPILHFSRKTEFLEADPTDNAGNGFDFAQVSETLKTTGVGFNLKAGLIYKPTEFWRLGLAVHSPTIYSLTDRYEAEVTANLDGSTTSDFSIDYTEGVPAESKYTLITPYRVIGSVSYVLREIQDVTKQRGFLTADVEYVNHKASSFSPDEESDNSESTKAYLKQLNRSIDRAYKGTFNFRAGGELKFTTVMVRLGAAYYGNPYKDINGEKGSRLNLSGGLGYRDKGFFVDLTYVHAVRRDVNFAYRLQSAPYFGATTRNTAGNVLLTVGFKI
ncbi:MAG TPA: aromatic hydrocarbon degradation protein [Flavisolibacter sp.]|nr:aromatic hydrocarbon degradation protein [Flavisolibacter sp.]